MVKELRESIKQRSKAEFREPSELSSEQLTDPDYRQKQLWKLNGGKLSIMCTKCHHCR